jgi:hypothetical protein
MLNLKLLEGFGRGLSRAMLKEMACRSGSGCVRPDVIFHLTLCRAHAAPRTSDGGVSEDVQVGGVVNDDDRWRTKPSLTRIDVD